MPNADSGRVALAEGCFTGTAGFVLHRRTCPRVRARGERRIAGIIYRRDGVQPDRSRLVPVRPWST
jgi:hypothetical protein